MDTAGEFLEKGDLIEFKNDDHLTAHWGIYDGRGYIIHVIGEVNPHSSINGPVEVVSAIMGDVEAYVRKGCLQTVANGRKFYKNNFLDETRTPRNADDIIRKASKYIDKVWNYRLLSSNCEHFASEMRYGEAISFQAVEGALSTAAVFGAIVIGGLVHHFRKSWIIQLQVPCDLLCLQFYYKTFITFISTICINNEIWPIDVNFRVYKKNAIHFQWSWTSLSPYFPVRSRSVIESTYKNAFNYLARFHRR